jgi:hypothetical protein
MLFCVPSNRKYVELWVRVRAKVIEVLFRIVYDLLL